MPKVSKTMADCLEYMGTEELVRRPGGYWVVESKTKFGPGGIPLAGMKTFGTSTVHALLSRRLVYVSDRKRSSYGVDFIVAVRRYGGELA